MSKIAIQGNASGTGTLTIAAPNTNTNYTLTLPTNSGTILSSATTASSIPGYGNQIIEADQWRLTTTLTAPSGDLTSNLERNDTIFAKIGTGMSQSSGIFTFPVTGIYLVSATIQGEAYSDGTLNIDCLVSTDGGSTYPNAVFNASGGDRSASGTAYCGTAEAFINVTNTTNFKLKFNLTSFSASSTLFGSTTTNLTFFTFIRLGDSV